jgi:hypothetical protein
MAFPRVRSLLVPANSMSQQKSRMDFSFVKLVGTGRAEALEEL